MDWIKVLNRHTIFEYTDLTDSEFTAWIKIMSLTAYLEKEPSREQMLKYTHHKTLTSLQDKLKTHSTTLQEVLKKVLRDAQEVVIKRERWKEKKQKLREDRKIVSGDVSGDVPRIEKRREEKRREENKKIKDKCDFILPEWIKKETWEAYREMRTRKRAPLTNRAANLIVKELAKLKFQGDAPEDVLNQSIMKSWTGVFPLKRGDNGNGQRFGSQAGSRIRPEYVPPPEYQGEKFTLTDDQRRDGLRRIADITDGIGENPFDPRNKPGARVPNG